jgi:hypothetical protein
VEPRRSGETEAPGHFQAASVSREAIGDDGFDGGKAVAVAAVISGVAPIAARVFHWGPTTLSAQSHSLGRLRAVVLREVVSDSDFGKTGSDMTISTKGELKCL